MATVKKTMIKLKLSDGKSAVINLPAPINNQLTDPDTSDSLFSPAFDAIKAAYADDDGNTVESASFYIVETKTTGIIEDFVGE